MPNDAWQRIDNDDVAGIMEDINPSIQPVPFSPVMTKLSVIQLSFYEDFKLYKMTNYEARHGVTKYALRKPGHAAVMNGTTEPIYKINEIAPVHIEENNVVDYIKVFFTYVRGEGGAFRVVESLEDCDLEDTVDTRMHLDIMSKVSPVALLSVGDNGVFNLQGYFLFDNALVRLRIQVDQSGKVVLSDKKKMMDVLPERNRAAAKVDDAIGKVRAAREAKENLENE